MQCPLHKLIFIEYNSFDQFTLKIFKPVTHILCSNCGCSINFFACSKIMYLLSCRDDQLFALASTFMYGAFHFSYICLSFFPLVCFFYPKLFNNGLFTMHPFYLFCTYFFSFSCIYSNFKQSNIFFINLLSYLLYLHLVVWIKRQKKGENITFINRFIYIEI